jgi:hypothetical protein
MKSSQFPHYHRYYVFRGLIGYVLQQRELPPTPPSGPPPPLAAILSLLATPPHPTKHLPPLDWSGLESLVESYSHQLVPLFARIIAR